MNLNFNSKKTNKNSFKGILMFCFFAAIVICSVNKSFAQNVGINGTGAAPDNAAMLDVSSSTKAFLAPRVALTSTIVFAPVAPSTSSVTAGFLVFNTANGSAGATAVYANNYYYWDGTKWNLFGYSGVGVPGGFNTNGLTATAAGAGTYVVPAGVSVIKVALCGGSGCSGTTGGGGGAGGDGGMVWGELTVTPGESLSYTVGGGGATGKTGGAATTLYRGATLLCAAGGGGGGGSTSGPGDAGGAAFGVTVAGGTGAVNSGGISGNNYIYYLSAPESLYGIYIGSSYTYYNVGSASGTYCAGCGSSAATYGPGKHGFFLVYY